MSEPAHPDEHDQASMVDVMDKGVAQRWALARAVVRVTPETARQVADGDAATGDVVTVARVAGIQAAKRTHELIPLCQLLPLSFIGVEVSIDAQAGTIELRAEARTVAQTGIEMVAMTAASVAALTVYDVVKGVESGARIEAVELIERSGGRSGHRVRSV